MSNSSRRWLYAIWLLLIAVFAIVHALNLRADFPNHSPWYMDWAKYTDEGWYGNAAVRAHLFGNWYLPGDFNPAPAVPVWPFLEWVLFFFTGVTIQAARGLAIAFFFINLLLSYLLLRARGPRWTALLAVTLLVTSPFLYCFSRLAILEPMLTAFTLAAMNLAIRLPRFRRPVFASISIGFLFTLMMLTKTTAVFLLPALGWAVIASLWHNRKLALRCALTAAAAFAVTFGAWMTLIVRLGLLPDYKYLFFVNNYTKPKEFYWPLLSLWWSFHGGLWVDHILIPLAGPDCRRRLAGTPACVGPQAAARPCIRCVRSGRGRLPAVHDLSEPSPAALLCGGGPLQFYCCVAGSRSAARASPTGPSSSQPSAQPARQTTPATRIMGLGVIALAALAVGINGVWTLNYAAHPEYTLVDAAERLTNYIDAHPNGKRLLVSISGDQISLIAHLPALCDDFGTPTPEMPDLVEKLAYYQPGWWATWNDIDPGTLEDLHTSFSLEQVASFHALDDRQRNNLVLFKLHPLTQTRSPDDENLQIPLPGDKIDIPLQ